MERAVVEFETVKTWWPEQVQKERDRYMHGESSVDIYNKEDWKGKVTVNMMDVVEFEEGIIFMNDKALKCTFAIIDEREFVTRNLLIEYDDFKKIYESVHNIDVRSYKDFFNTGEI